MPKNTDGTFTLCKFCPTRGQCAGHNVCGISHTAGRAMSAERQCLCGLTTYERCKGMPVDGALAPCEPPPVVPDMPAKPRTIMHTAPDVWHDDDGIWSAAPGAPWHALGPFASEAEAEYALHARKVDTVDNDHLDYPAHSPYCMCVQSDEPEA